MDEDQLYYTRTKGLSVISGICLVILTLCAFVGAVFLIAKVFS